MTIEIDMQGKVAMVTGAASGLGRATAIKLAEARAAVCLVDINETGLQETAELVEAQGAGFLACLSDLTDLSACKAPVELAVEHFGRLDALCNVAGLIYLTKTPDMASEQLERTISVNLMAPFLLSQAAIPHLLETGGAIVNVASSAAFIGEAYAAAYCASKWGVVGMTKAMAMEYVKQDIRINAVAPGGMMTNIAANITMPQDADIELISRFSGLRGLVEVDDVADMICLLASDAGRGFHGACINLDAGITAG